MSTKRKLKRRAEVKRLKEQRNEILKKLEISKSKFFDLAPRVNGTGMDYDNVEFRSSRGYMDEGKKGRVGYHKPSLKSQYSLLYDMHLQKIEDDEMLQRVREELDAKKEREESENENEG